ncbi:hypothetical protein Patl1_19889 [Pistacia atlantica]|uniref:Uncharacterized protein n=1 Tax=Pistacia atlantica TaxID=434234 RepID=A0ACC1BNB6_9ROSI|nr:hypothetical protein Patl1_19889 [Pistacia atlantica]
MSSTYVAGPAPNVATSAPTQSQVSSRALAAKSLSHVSFLPKIPVDPFDVRPFLLN